MDLSDLRCKIDEIDYELVRLFCERMRISGEIAHYKSRNGLEIFDPERELAKLSDIKRNAEHDFHGYIEELYARVFELSREYQAKSWL
ncbi:MAG: chorismate mutase [Oscillospiraceae bacterium]|nr:chorismate mutase [Oscillospiraceae bacterium]